VRRGERVRLEVEVDNPNGAGYGGAVKRILQVLPVVD
jgi:hypothetical protein